MLLPSAPIVHSRQWKAQVPYLARHFRVVTFDGRGNGRSDRPTDPAAYADDRMTSRTSRAVLDATGTDRAVLVGLCIDGVWRSIRLAADASRSASSGSSRSPSACRGSRRRIRGCRRRTRSTTSCPTDEGWAKINRHYWRRDYPGFARFFFAEMTTEPHSTKAIEDAVGWALDGSVEAMLAESEVAVLLDREAIEATCRAVRCPVLLVHGTEDHCQPIARAHRLAELTGAPLVVVEGADHMIPRPPPGPRQPADPRLRPLARQGARDMTDAAPRRTRTWTRALSRRRRALYLSSPIGLGHALRDVAIADELRKLQPDLEIDWLAQHPVTAVLEARGERVHPLSAELASRVRPHRGASRRSTTCTRSRRSAGWTRSSSPTSWCSTTWSSEGEYDLVIGDEAWDVDYFLHENPELKRTAFAWMTDFVGWLPMPDGGEREAFLTADYNAEMIEHVERFPRIRDRSIFVGDPDDIVPDDFGPGPAADPRLDRAPLRLHRLRHRLRPGAARRAPRGAPRASSATRPDERVVIVTVGGSGVGEALLRRVIAALSRGGPAGQRPADDRGRRAADRPGVARRAGGRRGPRLRPATCTATSPPATSPSSRAGSRRRWSWSPPGGRSSTSRCATTSSRTSTSRHRLERYGAGRCMDYDAVAART